MFEIPKGYEKYCNSSFFCESDDEYIKKLAHQISKKNKSPRKVAENFYLMVRDQIGWNLKPIIGAKKIINKKPQTAICLDHVNLFNALCRSVNIPARYMFMSCEFDFKKKQLPRKISHVVSEIYLDDDWQMVDPTFGAKDSEILDIHGFGKPNWERSWNVYKITNVPRPIIFLANLWVKIYPKARKVRKFVNNIHK